MKIKKRLQSFIVITVMLTSGTLAHATYQKTSETGLFRPLQVITGTASWYSEKSPGVKKTTANMEVFDDADMTCAMWNVPFHQKLRVTNLENGRSVVVRVNDRGPHKRFVREGRVIDLSKGAFCKISALNQGLIAVKIEFI